MLFLLLSLFFLNREMRRNQSDLERALKELELRRSIEDSMNLALIITDLDNKIVYTNVKLRKLPVTQKKNFWARHRLILLGRRI